EAYAFPLTRLHRALRIPRHAVEIEDGRKQILVEGATATLLPLRTVLGFADGEKAAHDEIAAVVFSNGAKLYALEVDRIAGETDLVVRPLDPRLGKVPGISAAAVGEDGAPILIVDVEDLPAVMEKIAAGEMISEANINQPQRKRVLVVDDSATVRATERQILENAGYAVETSVDGADGWNAVRLGRFDLVVSDVDMPRLNGLEFVARIRADPKLKSLPIIMVSYKDRAEDAAVGRAAGADIYFTKGSLQDGSFINAVSQLLQNRA
ncbi:MAG TPA: response regulator, partial [Opitutales bacterium]|nr:response regulator [Opitutales bacterium]